ncbi:hypothetical protein NKW43_15055 [Gluconobacter albidus]|uniref:hypothetical protein n=1 Tax=Gluconobacter albidus TaxID=318683 RepID=UPI00209D6CCC|nr:hypothetical protein [Gluconobacter albidus]MCP1274980.1 hypothetical protein [Gluconobacter albidus]
MDILKSFLKALKIVWIDWIIQKFIGMVVALGFCIWGIIDIIMSYTKYSHIYSSDLSLAFIGCATAVALGIWSVSENAE